ncbi:MAG: GWxTD domain-containing protein [Bacteroidales bacterium]
MVRNIVFNGVMMDNGLINKRIFFLAVLFLVGCKTSWQFSVYDIAGEYSNARFLDPEWHMHHLDDSTTRFTLYLSMNDFRYEPVENSGAFKAHYEIRYRIHTSYTDKTLIDSFSRNYIDSAFHPVMAHSRTHVFELPLDRGENYLLRLDIYDRNAMLSDFFMIDVPKKNFPENGDFLIINHMQDTLNRTHIMADEHIKIVAPEDIPRLWVRYYTRDFPIAKPPFSEGDPVTFDYTADSVFSIPMRGRETDFFALPDQGIYHFQLDTNTRQGLTLFRFYRGFPEMDSPQKLILPLRYITSEKEYDALTGDTSAKLALDRFWLDNTGNPVRAKKTINKFYNRVILANRLFSSYLEGWKTDRGMIYIVFGPPKIVYRDNISERWIYGEEKNVNSLELEFVKVSNPFTQNDFMLIRSSGYKEKWYQAVLSWRR